MNKSLFISFEGGDGAGKTTLIKSLHKELAQLGENVIETRAPGGTEIGKAIRHVLLSKHASPMNQRCELFLYLADRAQHVEEVILPALAAGKVVLCDRFNDSTVAYQAYGRDIGEERVRELCRFACKGVEPDLTFFLDIDPEVGLKRLSSSKDRLESEDIEFHKKIRQAYQEIARQDPKRCRILNADLAPKEVYEQAMHVLASYR